MSEQVKVVLDVHEPKSLYGAFENHPEVESVMLAPLPSADISIGGVGFERKTLEDYVNSMKEGRLTEQALKMDSYSVAYVLVEGDMADTETLTHTDMPPASIRGHIASLTAREEYPVRAVIPCSNTALLADVAVRLARKHSVDPMSTYLPTGAVGKDEPPGKQMWGCLPHVGAERAKTLYERFDGPIKFAWGSYNDDMLAALTSVEGIGEQTAKDILAAIWEVEEV